MVKLDKNDVKMIRFFAKIGRYTDKELAALFKVSRAHINKIKNKKRWLHEELNRES